MAVAANEGIDIAGELLFCFFLFDSKPNGGHAKRAQTLRAS
jgi:hypothetical protein